MSTRSSPAVHGFALGLNEGTLALTAAAILLFGAAMWCAHGPNVEKTDFSLTYVGATIVRQGLGHSLYDIALQKQVRDSLFTHPSPLLFEHPPFEALIFSPLAALPFRTAYLIWALFNAALWMLLIIFLRLHLRWPREDLGYVMLWLLFAPLAVALYQGQSSLVVLALYTLAFVCLKHSQDFPAGMALGFGLFKFQFVLPFALIFLVRRKWRFLVGFTASALLLGVFSMFTVGGRGLAEYARFLLTIGSNPQNESFGSAVDMPTLYGLVHAIFRGRIGYTELNVAVAFLSILLLGLVAWRWNTTNEIRGFDFMFSAAIAASLVAGSHMFTHDFSPLVLPMFLVAGQLSSPNFPLSGRVVIRLALALLWTFPIYFLCVAWHCLYLMCLVLLVFVYLAVRGADFIDSKNQELETAAVR
jgi:hypothetical protein